MTNNGQAMIAGIFLTIIGLFFLFTAVTVAQLFVPTITAIGGLGALAFSGFAE